MSKLRRAWDYILQSSISSFVGGPLAAIMTLAVILILRTIFPEEYKFIVELWDQFLVNIAATLNTKTDLVRRIAIAILWLFAVLAVLMWIRQLCWGKTQVALRDKRNLIKSFGAYYFSERICLPGVDDETAHGKDWEFFLETVKKEKSNNLKILGASGVETFCDPESPLHDLIETFKGEVQVLMLNPFSSAKDERADSLKGSGCTRANYRDDIKKSLNYLSKLSTRKNGLVKYKVYDHLPSWKMVMTDKYLWLQYYFPGDHVANSVVHIYYKNNDETSMYMPYFNEFNRLWNSASVFTDE